MSWNGENDRRGRATLTEMRQRAPWWAVPVLAASLTLFCAGFVWIVSTVKAQETETAVQKSRLNGVEARLEKMDATLGKIWDAVRK